MIKKYILPAIALVGLVFGVFMIYYSTRTPPTPPILFPPPKPPYAHYVSGAGIIEAASENIEIGTPFNEVVEEVFVIAGDKVKEGDPLFRLNTETIEAEMNEAIKQREVAMVNYQDERTRFRLYDSLKDKRAVSEDDYNQRYYAFVQAEKEVEQAQKRVEVFQTNIERSLIRAPMDGEVLQIKVRKGQNADINPFNQNEAILALFGRVDPFHIRVDIDETDSWRIQKNAPATAYVRGNSSIKIPLEFVRIEPYIVPKQSLTGANTERVDTRVLQLIYKFDKKNFPVFMGQLLDVYIESLPGDLQFCEGKTFCH